MLETINIALASDDTYFVHARVMLCSLLENNKAHRFHLYLFTESEGHDELEKIKNLVAQYHHTIEVVHVNKEMFEGFYTSGHISLATYYRLIIPDLIPHVERILYLDTDIIIKADIGELWRTELDDYCLAAVDEVNRPHVERLNLPTGDAYFNAGVLLINNKVWQQLNITGRGLEIAETYKDKLVAYDQDVLNMLLYNQWKKLPQKWNQTEGHPLGRLLDEPTIIHFVGFKPWTIHCIHPYKNEYYYYYYKMEGVRQQIMDTCDHYLQALKRRIPFRSKGT